MRLNDLAFKGVGFLLILPALLLASGELFFDTCGKCKLPDRK